MPFLSTKAGTHNVRALITRIGLWGFLILLIVYIPPNPILIVKAPTLYEAAI